MSEQQQASTKSSRRRFVDITLLLLVTGGGIWLTTTYRELLQLQTENQLQGDNFQPDQFQQLEEAPDIASAAPAGTASIPKLQWQVYEPENGQCRVEVPGTVKYRLDKMPGSIYRGLGKWAGILGLAKIDFHSFIIELPNKPQRPTLFFMDLKEVTCLNQQEQAAIVIQPIVDSMMEKLTGMAG